MWGVPTPSSSLTAARAPTAQQYATLAAPAAADAAHPPRANPLNNNNDNECIIMTLSPSMKYSSLPTDCHPSLLGLDASGVLHDKPEPLKKAQRPSLEHSGLHAELV